MLTINEITWPFRLFFYRIKMLKRFYKHLIMGWESIDAMTEIPYEIFLSFYRTCLLKDQIVDWEATKGHSAAKKLFDECYQYLMVLRPAYKKNYEWFLSTWCDHFVSEFVAVEDEEYERWETKYKNPKLKEIADGLLKRTNYYKDLVYKKDLYYSQQLMKYKDYMWE